MTFNPKDNINYKVYKVYKVKKKRIDASNVEIFKKNLLANLEKTRIIVLDMSEVDFIDSSVHAALISIYKEIRPQNKKLIICGLSEKFLSFFDLTGITKLFEIYPTKEDAIEKYKLKKI